MGVGEAPAQRNAETFANVSRLLQAFANELGAAFLDMSQICLDTSVFARDIVKFRGGVSVLPVLDTCIQNPGFRYVRFGAWAGIPEALEGGCQAQLGTESPVAFGVREGRPQTRQRGRAENQTKGNVDTSMAFAPKRSYHMVKTLPNTEYVSCQLIVSSP